MTDNKTDIINELAGLDPSDPIAALRDKRGQAKENAQLSFTALLEPDNPGGFSYTERYAVAAFVTGFFQAERAYSFYADLLADDAEPRLVDAVAAAVERARLAGPYSGGGYVLFDADTLGTRLAAAFDYAHLIGFHPKDADAAALGHLDQAGWGADEIVSLAQLISFLAFQVRVVRGLQVLSLDAESSGNAAAAVAAATSGATSATTATSDQTQETVDWAPTANIPVHDIVEPTRFVNHALGWAPNIPPLAKEDVTAEQRDALIKPERIDAPYFRLLARDPAALKARTLTDLDIFYNTDGGMGRSERELAATVVSRFNGCEYCASVHQQRSKEEGGDAAVIDRLLDEGVDADMGTPAWSAIRDAAVALTRTPIAFGSEHLAALRAQGFDDLAIIDMIYSAAFFNWANRLMLSLGQAEVPKRFQA